jgi:arginyl-tRNA synthetase
VRVKNIRRKLREAGLAADLGTTEVGALPAEVFPDDLWDLILEVAQTGETVEKGVESLELSLIARHALGLAQRFNGLYHNNKILHEPDAQIRAGRLAMALIFFRGLESVAGILSVPIPERM